MNHLIIYAHPSEQSFSRELTTALQNESSARGWKSTVRDLYAMKFDPVLWPSDLEGLKNGSPNALIDKEQQLLNDADIISLVYPLWWAGFPAILKGYIDKVLAYGFAYKVGQNGIEGLLGDKKIYLYTSMGNTLDEYEQKGLIDAFKKIQGNEIFEFCGMKVQEHLFFPQVPQASKEQLQVFLNKALSAFEPETKERVEQLL